MSRTILIELSGDNRHFVVSVPDLNVTKPLNTRLIINSLPLAVVRLANAIIDVDTRTFVKSRYRYVNDSCSVCQHELDWFMRGDVHHVSMEKMVQITKKLYG